MNNRITSAEIKRKALTALKGRWGIAIIATLVASIFGADGSGGISFDFSFDTEDVDFTAIQGSSNPEQIVNELKLFIDKNQSFILGFLGAGIIVGLLFSIAFLCLTCIVKTGYSKFTLDFIDEYEGLDNRRASIGTLFTYFNFWKSAIFSNLLVSLYTFLWGLLGFVPILVSMYCVISMPEAVVNNPIGFVIGMLLIFIASMIPSMLCTYKYAMVPFIVAEYPEIKAQEALEASVRIMNGHKLELFSLYLSFVGWSILCVFTLGIGFIWLTPYMNISVATFYREVTKYNPVYSYSYQYTQNY